MLADVALAGDYLLTTAADVALFATAADVALLAGAADVAKLATAWDQALRLIAYQTREADSWQLSFLNAF